MGTAWFGVLGYRRDKETFPLYTAAGAGFGVLLPHALALAACYPAHTGAALAAGGISWVFHH